MAAQTEQAEAGGVTEKSFGERLHDGMRLLSDDFGEQDDDDFVTFRDQIHAFDYYDEPDHWQFWGLEEQEDQE
jgi:hypothetical protein